MPKAHKPGKSSNISLAQRKGTTKVASDWKLEDSTSYLVVPRTIRSFPHDDPRKSEWRINLPTKEREQ